MPAIKLKRNISEKDNRLAVVILAVGSFTLINTEFLPVGLLSEIASFFNVSTGEAGLVITAPGVAAAISAPSLMLFAGKWDRRYIMISMILMVVLANLVIYIADNYLLALFSRILLGIAVGGYWSFSMPFAMNLVSDEYKSRAAAIVVAGISAGTVAGVPLGTFFGITFGWKNAFWMNGIFAAIVLCLQVRFIPSVKEDTSTDLSVMWKVLTTPAITQRLLAAILYGAAHFTAFTYYEPLVLTHSHLPGQTLPLFMLGYGIAGLMGTFLAENLIRKVSPRGTLAISVILLVCAICSIITVPATIATIMIITLVWGIAFGLMPVSINVWLAQASGDKYEIASSLNVTAFQIAIATGSLFGGMLVGKMGITMPFIIGIVMGLMCLGMLKRTDGYGDQETEQKCGQK
ncbi:MFS transporter [Escherichia coli]|uniref:MFS transporter n=1 Tax=Escherichia coli TaxID=562 RepID=UPI000E1D2173|nr:MFS transporter [Escherichia coli]EFH6920375.1 MFS transporter [Escherichia coli]RDS02479.1 Purine ribonucleoside efflux pump NepI [Escherichia coli]RDS21322.1 Purine ribonucleoside efflux pump NepI [Escherichia coli]